jgi:NAD(P)H-hydrate epimerase
MLRFPEVLTRDEVRRVDRYAIETLGISGLVLMENAARGCADVLTRLDLSGPVLILCGRGNNGGDGYALARHLAVRGCEATVAEFFPPDALSADAAANRRWAVACGAACCTLTAAELAAAMDRARWIVDALLGTGAAGDPRPPLAAVIEAANNADARRLAVDIPSGLDADTGACGTPTFVADHTCTFVAKKPGMLTEDGPRRVRRNSRLRHRPAAPRRFPGSC